MRNTLTARSSGGRSSRRARQTIRSLPSEVVLEPGQDRVPRRSAVNRDSVESVSLAVLVEGLGRLAYARMREICAALALAVDCDH